MILPSCLGDTYTTQKASPTPEIMGPWHYRILDSNLIERPSTGMFPHMRTYITPKVHVPYSIHFAPELPRYKQGLLEGLLPRGYYYGIRFQKPK